jgi:hypothetical protein
MQLDPPSMFSCTCQTAQLEIFVSDVGGYVSRARQAWLTDWMTWYRQDEPNSGLPRYLGIYAEAYVARL